jgi:hypothetical protein
MSDSIPESTKNVLDAVSVGTAVGSLAGMLPHIAAVFTIIWTGIRIWETETVQGWLGRDKSK